MPLDGGVSTYIGAQYDAFMRGLATLSTGGQQDARAAAARQTPSDAQPASIHIPGADEVIQIIPRPAVTKDNWREHYQAEREGRASANSDAIEAEIGRRQATSARMQGSTTPESAQAAGQILTALDNVQDLLSTLAVVGRLALVPVAGLIPGVGIPVAILARGADILRLLTWIGLVATPLYIFLCEGGAGAVPAAVPALVFGRGLKQKVSLASQLNPFAKRGRGRGSWRTAGELGKRPTIYNAIEAAQVSKDWFGIGLTFGALVGALSDVAFGLAQAAAGKSVQLHTPTRPELFYNLLRPALDQYSTPALDDARAAAGVLARAPMVAWLADDLTAMEHVEHLLAVYAAFDFLRPVFDLPNLAAIVAEAEADTWTPPAYATFDSVSELTPHDARLAETARLWPVAGAPERLSGADLTNIGLAMATAVPERLLAGREETWEGWLQAALIARIVERSVLLMTRDPDVIAWELEPAYQLAESLCTASLICVTTQGDAAILAWASSCYDWLERTNRRQLPRDVLLELARAQGVKLTQLVPIGTPAAQAL